MHAGTPTFFAVAAQVLPVLALALIYEDRLFEHEPEEYLDPSGGKSFFWRLLLVALLAASESFSLGVLISGDTSKFATYFVSFGIVIALAMVTAGPTERSVKAHLDRMPGWVQANPRRAGSTIAVVVIFAALLPLYFSINPL